MYGGRAGRIAARDGSSPKEVSWGSVFHSLSPLTCCIFCFGYEYDYFNLLLQGLLSLMMMDIQLKDTDIMKSSSYC